MIKLTSLGSKVLIENGAEDPYTRDVVDMDFVITDSTHVSFDALGGVPIAISEFEIEGDVPSDIADFKTLIATVFPNAGGAATPTFLVYTALLSQLGTAAPTAIILVNTIGAIVWTRNDIGEYRATLTGAFPENKVIIFMGIYTAGLRTSNNIVTVVSLDLVGNLSDTILSDSPIEIRVYP